MATQAIISLVTDLDDPHTLSKIVIGCDGGQAGLAVAALARKKSLPLLFGYLQGSPEDQSSALKRIYETVANYVGCKKCLAVQGRDVSLFKGDEPLSTLYAEKFADPAFNPRWENGTAPYVYYLDAQGMRRVAS
jgi:hypothetical protein